jgi:hypothetical protein
VKTTTGNAAMSADVDAWQCIGATGGATYDLGAKILVPAGQTGTKASLGLWFFASGNCSGSPTNVFASPTTAASTWQAFTAQAQAPSGTMSVRFRLIANKPVGQTSAEALFDDITLVAH